MMGRSIIRMREDNLARFLLALPDGVMIRSASVDETDRHNILLLISGKAVPSVKEVDAIINTATYEGKRVRWLTFVEAKPKSSIIIPGQARLNG